MANTQDNGMAAILAQIAAIVKCILDTTIDLLCFLCFVVGSILMPLRIPQNINDLKKNDNESWRETLHSIGPNVLLASGLEYVTLPFALGAPTRWSVLWYAWHQREKINFDSEVRLSRIYCFFNGIGDCSFGFLGAVLCVLSPLRMHGFFKAVLQARTSIYRTFYNHDKVEAESKRLDAIRCAAVAYGISACLDVVLLLFSFVPCLLVPWRLKPFFYAHLNAWKKRKAPTTTELPIRDDYDSDDEWTFCCCCCCCCKGNNIDIKELTRNHVFWIKNTVACFVDIFALVAGLFSICTLVRAKPLLRAFSFCNSKESAQHTKNADLEQQGTTYGTSIARTINSDWDLDYDWQLRKVCFKNFALALYDLLGVIPLLITRIGMHRWPPIRQAFEQQRSSPQVDDTATPLIVWRQFGLLLFDLIFIPFSIIAIISPRRQIIFRAISNANVQDNVVKPHLIILFEFIIALHDFILLPIVALSLLLTIYRWPSCTTQQESRDIEEQIETSDFQNPFTSNSWRTRAWIALGNLLLDIPFSIMAIIVIVTGWRSPRLCKDLSATWDWSTRGKIFYEFLRLVADFFCLPFAVILLVTGYRFPAYFGTLRSKSTPLRGEPHLIVKKAHLTIATRNSLKLEIESSAEMNDLSTLNKLKHVRLRIIGNEFFKIAAQNFGNTTVGIVRSFLPLSLKDGQHISYREIAQGSFSLKFHRKNLKASTIFKKFKKMNDNQRFVLQIESNQSRPLLAIVVSVAQICTAAYNPDTPIEILLDDEIQTLREDEKSGGIVDSFATVTLFEIRQLILDIIFIFLFILIIFIPWRWIALVKILCEPKSMWPYRISEKVLKAVRHADQCMEAIRNEDLMPVLNEGAKLCAREWLEYRNKVPRINSSFHPSLFHMKHAQPYETLINSSNTSKKMKKIGEARLKHWISMRTRAEKLLELNEDKNNALFEHFSSCVTEFFNFQDASQYYIFLRAHFHSILALAQKQPEIIEKHALTIDCIDDAERVAARRRREMLDQLKSIKTQLYDEALSASKNNNSLCCSFNKSVNLCRKIIFAIGIQAILDMFFILLILLIICTVYRVVPLIADMNRAKAFSVTRLTTRMIVLDHTKGLGNDIILVITTLFAILLCCCTVVSIPAFLENLPSCESLKDIRQSAFDHASEICEYIFELCTLFTTWRTYRITVRAILFAYFVPAAAIADGFMRPLENKAMALRISTVLFTGLAVNAIFKKYAILLWNVFIVLVLCIIIPVTAKKCYTSDISTPNDELSPCLTVPRLTWPNLLEVLSIPFDALQCVAMFIRYYGTNSYLSWLTILAKRPVALLYVAFGIAAFWILLVSAPLAEMTESKKNLIENYVPHRQSRHFFGHVLYVFTIQGLLELLSWNQSPKGLSQASAILFVIYILSTTSSLTSRGQDLYEDGLDIKYEQRSLAAVRICQFTFIALVMGLVPGLDQSQDSLICVTIIWLMIEIFFLHRKSIVFSLRITCAALTLWILISVKFSIVVIHFAIVLGALTLIGMIMFILKINTTIRMNLPPALDAIREIHELHGTLFTNDDYGSKKDIHKLHKQKLEKYTRNRGVSAKSLSALLLEIEKSILFRRLDINFVAYELNEWRHKLTNPQMSMDQVQSQANILKANIIKNTSIIESRKILVHLAVKKQLPLEIISNILLYTVSSIHDIIKPSLICPVSFNENYSLTNKWHHISSLAASQANCIVALLALEPIAPILNITKTASLISDRDYQNDIVQGTITHGKLGTNNNERSILTLGYELKRSFCHGHFSPRRIEIHALERKINPIIADTEIIRLPLSKHDSPCPNLLLLSENNPQSTCTIRNSNLSVRHLNCKRDRLSAEIRERAVRDKVYDTFDENRIAFWPDGNAVEWPENDKISLYASHSTALMTLTI